MGLLDKFNELKDMVTGAVEEAKGQAGEMAGDATDAAYQEYVPDMAGQAGDAVQGAQDAVQGAGDSVQNAQDSATGAVEDFRNEHGL
ncbi:hypothetical protein [Glycomyces terrestris]|uniref:Antitoxin n=1 Tax=Glycomyces terrestris TaxID=2493553 RepID=A0A426UV60_9ACTN|nr:hypothetical protein [Glycomyces terrestris]RRR98204.1 hypothetical protein EIW28_14900 [Glycomyces terrestris]